MDDIQRFIEKAKRKGCVTNIEVLDVLPPDIVYDDQIEDIVSMLEDMGVEVRKEKAKVYSFAFRNKN